MYGKKNHDMRKYSKIILIVTVFILIISLITLNFILKGKDNLNSFKNDIQSSWSDSSYSCLQSTKLSLELAIERSEVDPYNDDILTNWFLNNSQLLNTNQLTHFIVFDMEYDFLSDDKEIDNVLNKYDLRNEQKHSIKNSYKNFLQNYNTVKNEDIVNHLINTLIEQTKVNDGILTNIVNDCICKKSNVLFSANDKVSEDLKEALLDDEFTIKEENGENLWCRTITIPSGSLGFYNQPSIINNNANLKYRKIAISVCVNEDEQLQPYYEHLESFNNISNTCLLLVSIIALSSFSIIAIFFYKNLIKLNKESGDNNANENNRANSIIKHSRNGCNS